MNKESGAKWFEGGRVNCMSINCGIAAAMPHFNGEGDSVPRVYQHLCDETGYSSVAGL
jgi:hypothetical protein